MPRPAETRPRAPIHPAPMVAAALLTLAGPAAAEITAEQAVTEFQDYFAAFGYAVEAGSQEAGDGTITLSDARLDFDLTGMAAEDATAPEPNVIELTLEEITFTEQDDGTVRVTTAPGGQLRTAFTDEATNVTDTSAHELTIADFVLTIAEAGEGEGEGGGDGRTYDFDVGSIASRLLKATQGGEPVDAQAAFVISGYRGTNTVLPESEVARSYDTESTLEAVSLQVTGPAMDGTSGEVDVSLSLSDLSASGTGRLPADMAGTSEQMENDPSGFMRSILNGDFTTSTGPFSVSVSQQGSDQPQSDFTFNTSHDGADVTASVGEGGLSYETTARGIQFTASGGDLPVPSVEGGYDEGTFAVTMPLFETEEAQPAAFRMSLDGLTFGDNVWSLFDPSGQLPRDPASLAFTLDGQMRVLQDFFDPEAMAASDPDAQPFAFDQAGINLSLNAVGAMLEATGDFEIDNEDLTTFNGMPAATGTLNVQASGIDGLLDTLADMGLVAPDQLMPARMMLGLFARSDGEGGYTSSVEIDGATGEITANGQRIR